MKTKKLFAVGCASAALMAAGAGTASAGEVTGNGKPTQGPAHAHSICVYSGQNDNPTQGFPEGGRTQSYGQLVRQGVVPKSPGPAAPGVECNGHSGVLAGGGTE